MAVRSLAAVLAAASLAAPAGHAMTPPAAAPAKADAAKGQDARARARQMADKAIAYLRSKQDPASGGWGVAPPESGRPVFPAITGLVVTGMLANGSVPASDPAMVKAQEFMLKHQQPDGGIYDRVLPSYNTAIVLSALAKLGTPEARAAIPKAQDFLRKLQWSEFSAPEIGGSEAARPIDKTHPFYGGIGYGSHGRPDLSNLSFMLQGLHDSGVPGDDPAFQRALVFLQRVQMLDSVNDMPYADGSRQGGFVYSTGPSKDEPSAGQSQAEAATIEETMDDGTKVSRLRCYGSMTYAGFKSYIYAGLRKDDPRVLAAKDWISRNYTLEENPGAGTDGMYYYFVTFARAMQAWGEPRLSVRTPSGEPAERDWRADLVERLSQLQNPDGSFKSVDDRWMENDPVLITAYSLMALQAAAE